MRNVKKILDCCSKPCVVHVLCLLPLLAFYFLLNSVDAQNQRCSYGNGAALLVFKLLAYGRTDGRTDSHMTTKIFQIDGLPNFLRHGAPLARQELRYNWNNRQPHMYAMRTYFFILLALSIILRKIEGQKTDYFAWLISPQFKLLSQIIHLAYFLLSLFH